ncbi:MAG: hypothetical protein KGS72_08315 [Cyanobacteria bacterium REEB67]|nr:hypothetical protein [Cyanobacteria bacterium REEB67]
MSELPDKAVNSGSSSSGYNDHTDSLAFFNGQEALDLSNFAAAANNFTLLIERHPHDPQYHWLRARAYCGMRAWHLCREDCEQAIQLGMSMPQVIELRSLAAAEEVKVTSGAPLERPEMLALVSLRQKYRLRSLLLSADEHLAEGDYLAVLSLVNLAERLLEPADSSGDLGFSIGLIRVRACIGAGKSGEALEVIDFYVKHAHLARREDFAAKFKALRSHLF